MGVRTSDIDSAAVGATPSSHASSHQDGGTDEVSVTGLSGVLADAQVADKIKTAGGGSVAISGTAPIASQILVANIDGTACSWQTVVGVAGVTPDPLTNGFRLSPDYTPIRLRNAFANAVHMVPYTGNTISLYNGSSWDYVKSNGALYTLAGRTVGLPFNVFAYNNAGTLALEVVNWSSPTDQTMEQQNGVWCKTGDHTRRWVGTCCPTIVSSSYNWVVNSNIQTDGAAEIGLWNVDNRAPVSWQVIDKSLGWAYTSTSWRAARGQPNARFIFVAGTAYETAVTASLLAHSSNTAAGVQRKVAIGLNSNALPAFGETGYSTWGTASAAAGAIVQHSAHFSGSAPLGLSSMYWLESSAATGSTSWYGNNTDIQSGMTGIYWC